MVRNSRILVIGDIHAPFQHRDTVAFLAAIKEEYEPTTVVLIGDEIDGQSISNWDHDPDLPAPNDELSLAIKALRPIYELFPRAYVLESNHGSLVYRRGKKAGLPSRVLKPYSEVLEAPKHWVWVPELVLDMPDGRECYFTHGKTTNPLKLSQTESMCAVQGHHHNQFAINYWSNSRRIYWQAFTGCLVDDKSLAMAYNKTNLLRPMLGSLMILHGHPRLIPMIVDKNNRWIGRLA